MLIKKFQKGGGGTVSGREREKIGEWEFLNFKDTKRTCGGTKSCRKY